MARLMLVVDEDHLCRHLSLSSGRRKLPRTHAEAIATRTATSGADCCGQRSNVIFTSREAASASAALVEHNVASGDVITFDYGGDTSTASTAAVFHGGARHSTTQQRV
jgi:hypothetical protein